MKFIPNKYNDIIWLVINLTSHTQCLQVQFPGNSKLTLNFFGTKGKNVQFKYVYFRLICLTEVEGIWNVDVEINEEKPRWADKKTNEEVLSAVNQKRWITSMIVRWKKNWRSHVMRKNCLLERVLDGGMIGKRTRRRPRAGMIDYNLRERLYERIKRMAECRKNGGR